MAEDRNLPWNPIVDEVHSQLEEVRNTADARGVIAWISARLASVSDLSAKVFLMSELAGEYDIRGEYESAERVLRERIQISNDATQSWIGLAEHYHYASRNLHAARDAIAKALEQALLEGAFVRQAAAARIRIALALNDYATADETLRLMLTDAARTSYPDVAYETDFVSRISVSNVDSETLRRYVALARGGCG